MSRGAFLQDQMPADGPGELVIDPADYDVGPDCPRDALQARLDAARRRLRLNPPVLGPLRWLS